MATSWAMTPVLVKVAPWAPCGLCGPCGPCGLLCGQCGSGGPCAPCAPCAVTVASDAAADDDDDDDDDDDAIYDPEPTPVTGCSAVLGLRDLFDTKKTVEKKRKKSKLN